MCLVRHELHTPIDLGLRRMGLSQRHRNILLGNLGDEKATEGFIKRRSIVSLDLGCLCP
mgnify:CR=1 FL=1